MDSIAEKTEGRNSRWTVLLVIFPFSTNNIYIYLKMPVCSRVYSAQILLFHFVFPGSEDPGYAAAL